MPVATRKNSVLLTGRHADHIMHLAEKAHTPDVFKELVGLISQHAPTEWRPFGWNGLDESGGRVPASAIGAAPDPALLLAEPVMNSFDALFELEMGLRALGSSPLSEPRSPREAAHVLFGVHRDGMAAWDVRRGEPRKRYEELARLTVFRILRGSRANTPTLMFRDDGLGQHPSDFWRTILSLQLGNKANVPYTAGQYGHGAGMLLGFTTGGQVMISRRHPKLLADDLEDFAGLVLVRKRKPSEAHRTQPHYECLVAQETSVPFAFSPKTLSNPSWHGLQRTCIDYELPQFAFQAIYDAMDHVLPCPPLPYELIDERNE